MTRQTKNGVRHFLIRRKFKYSRFNGIRQQEDEEGNKIKSRIISKQEILAKR